MSTSTSRRRTNPSESELSDGVDKGPEGGVASNSYNNDDEEESYDEEESDEYTDDSDVEEERDAADGESPHEDQLDDDEDAKNPAFIPRKGLFYEHDSRSEDVEEQRQPERDAEESDKQKLWKSKEKWGHDMFDEKSQAPKTREELIREYGYDITAKDGPPPEPPRHYNRGRGRRGKASLGDYANFSRSGRGQRGGRGSYNRGSRGGRYQSRNYDNSNRYNQSSQQMPDTQDVRTQDVRSQDVRSQDVRSQDARSQDVRSQDVRSQDVRSQDVRSQDVRPNEEAAQEVRSQESGQNRADESFNERLVDKSEPTPAEALNTKSSSNTSKSDQRVANQSGAGTNQEPSTPQPTPATDKTKTAAPAVAKEEARPKRYSKQRQNVANNPVAPQQPLTQSPQAHYTGAPSNTPTAGSPQIYMTSPAQLLTPQSFMPGSSPPVITSPARPPMAGALPTGVITGPPRQPLSSSRAPIPTAVISQSAPMPVAGMLPAGMSYVTVPNQGIPPQPVPVQGMPPQVMPSQGISQQAIATQQFTHRPQLTPQMPATPPVVSETGMPLGGAMYYQSPTPPRPAHEGTTYYPTPPLPAAAEPAGATFYTSPQQPAVTAQSGGTYYPPTAAATEQQGPVYYNTQAQAGITPGQSKPRVKNIIPIVKPEQQDNSSTEQTEDMSYEAQTATEQPITEALSKPDEASCTTDPTALQQVDTTIDSQPSNPPISELDTSLLAPNTNNVTTDSSRDEVVDSKPQQDEERFTAVAEQDAVQPTETVEPTESAEPTESVKMAVDAEEKTEEEQTAKELAEDEEASKETTNERAAPSETVPSAVDSVQCKTETESPIASAADESLHATEDVRADDGEGEGSVASDEEHFSDANETVQEGGDVATTRGSKAEVKVAANTPNEQGDAASTFTSTESQV